MVDASFEDLWFEFAEEPILPWSETAIPVNMLLSVLIVTGLLYALIRKNEQIEEEEEVRVFESLKKMKWHLEEEILEEAKKLSREEDLQRQKKSRSKSKSKSSQR
ncbi:unnamed protein product [Cylicocyclus nassatus]|uniref:Uncharacterized protein n=1 Tax=Cylicocyclus nassatus TaxID=53992 RepID=A0AA36GKJ7_CYLNA|nr:unnamed protein product [Cylicocyclus nassatus]